MTEPSVNFRDRIATSDDKGHRKWVYARLPKGRYTTRRHWVAMALILLFTVTPFIKVAGEPFILIDVVNRHFILFGRVFWPQDTYLLGIAMLTFVIFIILFTVVFGRMWCGWACPQTIFLEVLFRRIETWIEGSPAKQQASNQKPKTSGWYIRRTFKIVVFTSIILIAVNIFLSYFISAGNLLSAWKTGFTDYHRTLVAMIVLTAAGTFVYTWFREQACTILCPYGRLQGTLTDNDTIMVMYDYLRGEPRGKTKEGESQGGDCINCNKCVQVCPTGIDIRNGTQLECINCTACIDACDEVMAHIGKAGGLIRYTSEKEISSGEKRRFTGRMAFYTSVLAGLLIFLSILIMKRTEVETTILRTPGILFQRNENGTFSNLYNYKIVNKTRKDIDLSFKLLQPEGELRIIGNQPMVKNGASVEGVFFILLDSSIVVSHEMKIQIGLFDDDHQVELLESTFIGPMNKNIP